MRVISLDLSLTGTGIAHTHWHTGEPRLGCRTVRSVWGASNPHARIHDILTDVAAAARSRPDLAVVEGAAYGAKGSAVDQLAGLRWIARQWLWGQGVPYVEVAPATVKIWAAGSGAATKDAVKAGVIATYGRWLHVQDYDQADAVSMLTLALAAYGAPLARVTDPNRTRAMKAVRWPTLDVRPEVAAALTTPAPHGDRTTQPTKEF